ncbi:hypothetical protein OCU04_007937 [Sclerotinia nivalis]|uniref:Uncharacterized protein n=1 Tax=Sclerotinia nivalis TaxID=352851 RepID=A0A9X0AJU1_9HELO|nr:hypothetical protein OCU04_007937 [Sclerotinia nivalis]
MLFTSDKHFSFILPVRYIMGPTMYQVAFVTICHATLETAHDIFSNCCSISAIEATTLIGERNLGMKLKKEHITDIWLSVVAPLIFLSGDTISLPFHYIPASQTAQMKIYRQRTSKKKH